MSFIARSLCLLLICLAGPAIAQTEQSPWQGRPVRDYIESVSARGLNVIFSSDLVPAALLVLDEPTAPDAENALREVLMPHGLTLTTSSRGRLLVVPADCPPGRLRVKVIDRLTGTGIPGARVTPGIGPPLDTGADGVVVLRCLPIQDIDLAVTAGDYQKARATAALEADAGAEVTIALEPAAEPLTEIIVTSSVYTLNYEKAGSHAFLERELTSRLPDLGDEPMRAIERLPGTTSGKLSTRVHVRGGADSEQLILLDGLRLYEPFHLKDFLSFSSIIDQRAIAGIDFYSAGYPARYGDRMSGVIDIGLREPPPGRVTELGVSLFNTSALSAGSFDGRWSGDWLVSARRGNLDLVARAIRPEYGSPLTEDALAHIGFELGERAYLSANALFSFDKITLSDGEDEIEAAKARYSNLVFWLKADVDWSDRLSTSTLLSITDIANQRDGEIDNPGIVSGFVADDRDFQVVSLRQNAVLALAENWSLRAGADIKRMQATYAYRSERSIEAPFDTLLDNTPFRRIDIDVSPDGNQYAAYAELRWRPMDRLVVDAGLRWDRQTYTAAASDEQLSPRLNLRYDLSERSSLRFSAGRFYQAQEINELQIIDGLQSYYPAARADHFVTGLQHDFSGGVTLKLELYRKEYHGLNPRFQNILDPVVLLPDLQVDRTRIDATRAEVDGAEIMMSSDEDATGPQWWASYAWSQVRDRVAGGEGYVVRGWDQTHTVKGGINWDWRDWNVSAAATVHTGWPRTAILVTTVPEGSGGSTFNIDIGPRNNTRYSVFHGLDVRASRDIPVAVGELNAFVEITNLYNRKNPCCTEFERGPNENGNDRLRLARRGWLPIVPSVGVLWTF